MTNRNALPPRYTGCNETTLVQDSKVPAAHGDYRAVVITTTYAEYDNGRFIGGYVSMPHRIIIAA